MRIVILADAASLIGGADKVAIVSSVELARRGHKVTILAAMGPPDPMLIDQPNLEVICLNQPEVAKAPSKIQGFRTQLWNREAMQAMRGILHSLPEDDVIIHAHCYLKLLSSGVIKLALDSGKPFMVTMHDYGIACPNRIFYHQPERAICHRRPMGIACCTTNCLDAGYVHKVGMLVRFWVQRHIAKVGPRLRNVAFVSEFSQRIMRPYLPGQANCFVLRNPVDPQRESRANVSGNETFTYVGRLVSEKDPVTLARAARIAGVPVVFVGDGPETAKVLDNNPEAEVTGWVRPQEVAARLRASRAFVIPSIWYECSPLVTVEAQSHGLPVICSNTNASQESIENGVTGLLFSAGDEESLAQAITRLKDASVAERMSLATYERFWADPPSTEKHVEELLAAYEGVIARSRA